MGKEVSLRIKKLREQMVLRGLESVLITKRENYIYLSGFSGTSALLFITAKQAVLLTDFRYAEQAREQAPDYEIIKYAGSPAEAVLDLLQQTGVKNLGFEDRHITFKQYTEYSKKLNPYQMEPMGQLMDELRVIKDEEEIKLIRKAMEIADRTFDHILGYIKAGIPEIEIAAEIEYFMRKCGALKPSFDTIVVSGHRSSMPHGIASEKKIEKGDPVTMDFGAVYENYCSDLTRTVFVGEPSDEMKRIYRIVLEAQMKSLECVKAGADGKSVDGVARDVIEKNGYGDNFGHGLGHGVGLEIHEEPRLAQTSYRTLANGMVVTVEPGIYINGTGGVRIEDMVVVNGDKPIVLTAATKEMIIL